MTIVAKALLPRPRSAGGRTYASRKPRWRPSSGVAAPQPPQSATVEATLVENGSARERHPLDAADSGATEVAVADPAARQKLVKARTGDIVEIDLRLANGEPDLVTKLVAIKRPVSLMGAFS